MPKPTQPHPEIADLNDRMFRAGIRTTDLLARCGIADSSWTRWRRGAGVRPETLDRLNAMLNQMIEEEDHDGETT